MIRSTRRLRNPDMTRFVFLLLVGWIPAVVAAYGADASCRPMLDAAQKLYTVPVHIYSTETAAYNKGKVKEGEIIYVNNSSYLRINGQWRKSPITEQQRKEIQESAEKEDVGSTCRMVREEAVNGEAARLYSMHHQTADEKVDSQVWISKARGVPLKQETDMDAGGMAGKSHRTMRYEYSNVQAPAGIR